MIERAEKKDNQKKRKRDKKRDRERIGDTGRKG